MSEAMPREETPSERTVERTVEFDVPVERVWKAITAREDGGTTLFLRESGFRTDRHQEQNTEGWTEELAELIELLRG